MEADEENSGNLSLKRQRAPLSDSEDNVLSASEVNDTQKRRRLEAPGQENRCPEPSSSVRLVEQQTKPDTPVVPSVQSRVQQLTQRRDGGAPLAQRCLSDPGADSPSVIVNEKGFRENLLGEGEFHQRMERFKVPVFQASPAPTPSPTNSCPRPCSSVVSGIQQKLQGTTTPSSKRASRMRQEREQELSQLHFQPISENAWLKRSSSDPSLTQEADADPGLKDGSFTETLTSGAEKQPSNGTGERAPCDSAAPAAPVGPENSNEGLLQMGWKEQSAHHSEVRKEKEHRASGGNEDEQLGSRQSQTQSVLKLSFSEDQSFSAAEDQHVSELPTEAKESLLESTHIVELDISETDEVSKITEQSTTEVFSFEGGEEVDSYSYSEEAIEPSTEEELRLWRYPQVKVCREKESVSTAEQEEDVCANVCAKEKEEEMESSGVGKEESSRDVERREPSDSRGGKCYLADASAEIAGSTKMLEDEKRKPEEDELESEGGLDDSVTDHTTLHRDQGDVESCEGCYEAGDMDISQDQKDTEGRTHTYDASQQSKEVQTGTLKEQVMDLGSDRRSLNAVEQTEACPFSDVAQGNKETQAEYTQLETTIDDVSKPKVETEVESAASDGRGAAQGLIEVQLSDHLVEADKMEQDAVDEMQGVSDGLREASHKAEGGEGAKKVTFVLEPRLIDDSTLSETNTSMEARAEAGMSDAELSSHDETNTAEIIDQMFEEVLEYAGRMEEERADDEDTEDHDSGIGACVDRDKMDTESEKEKSEEEGEVKEGDCDESKTLEGNGDELLTFPPTGILSPLSKSVEAVVTPLRLAVSQESNPPTLFLTPEETSTPPAESAPLYSIDAYRTQRQSKQPTIHSVTPGVQRRAAEKSQPQPSVNSKERISALNEEAGKLQNVINQTLQALSCCTDEEHGRGSLEEAEAEKLLLVSCEKRSALLAEVARLREERNSESGETSEDRDYVSQQPCRGTVSITNIQLPLKVEFVCSSHNRTGRPSHYFFVLIRYGPCNIVATPLATAADAQNGDTISFPTAVTLKDIRSSFEIDVEVYSLSPTSVSNCSMDRTATKSRVTPRKLLNTITRSSNTLTSALPALSTRRSSNFCLVGSHKITLASLGHSKFPLDKMKLEGKIRRLLGDEFQEKVPFLSPLEGNIYLRLDSQSHSNVQHQGFLTMFELISGYGVWHRRYFVLHGCNMHYWNHPNDKETKEAEGSISLSSSSSQSVRPVRRDSCARPFTFELVSNIQQQQQDDSQEGLAKCWFSADTKQERLDWMEKLNQALLDFHTWNRSSATRAESQQPNTSSSGNLRESIL